jgi:transposase
MPRINRLLSPFEKKKIMKQYQSGSPGIRAIAKSLHRSPSTIQSFIQRLDEKGSAEISKGIGRKRKTTKKQDQLLITLSQKNPFFTAPRLRKELRKKRINLSVTTIKERLREAGLGGYTAKRKPLLTQAHRSARLDFARRWLKKKAAFWETVIFSDEKWSGTNKRGRVWVRRPKEGRFDQRYIINSERQPKGRTYLWGAFSANVKAPLIFRDRHMTHEGYEDALSSSTAIFNPTRRGRTWRLIDDNASFHSSQGITDILREAKITRIRLPPKSPDLNPIENVWSIITQKINNSRAESTVELRRAIRKAWNDIPQSILRNLSMSIPKRLREIIKQKGCPTKY